MAVEVQGVIKRFPGEAGRDVTALDRVSLSVQDNELFTLLGPSGCGKTTLLRLIAGFERPTEGQILLFGEHLEALPPYLRPVNTVFQHYALFPHMTVVENVAFALKMLGRNKAEQRRVADEMLALVQMEAFAERKPDQLSGGQQQRVALARALAPQPKVLLLDEPLSALDLKLRQAMRGELKKLQRKTGITFIFVTHDQEEALAMSDRIAVMSEGRVQQVGAPQQIYERPVNHFVADFIGDTNVFRVALERLSDGSLGCRLGGSLELSLGVLDGYEAGQEVTLAVRPENVQLFAGPNEEGHQTTGRIEEAVYLGTDTSYIVDLGQGAQVLARDQNVGSEYNRFAVGDEVSLTIAPNTLRILED